MPRGTRRHTDPPVSVDINIPTSIITQVDLLLVDPVRGKPAYGARSKLFTKLLRDWLHDVRQGKVKVTHYTGGV